MTTHSMSTFLNLIQAFYKILLKLSHIKNMASLKVLNLLDGHYNILHWMALLLKNRMFRLFSEINRHKFLYTT